MTAPALIDAFVAAKQDLQKAAVTLRWATPADVVGHQERLARLIDDATTSSYPEPFDLDVPADGALDDLLLRARDTARAALNGVVREAALDDIDTTAALVSALAARDGARYSAASVRRHGRPSADTTAWAEAILADLPSDPEAEPEPATVDADALSRAIRCALDGYALGWDVSVTDRLAARMSTSGSERRLNVRADGRVSTRDVARLTAHEVGGHVLRWENAWRQNEPLLAIPLGDTTPTEEGLALLAEGECGVQRDSDLRMYAGRVRAVQIAAEQGILQVARALAPHLGAGVAAAIAIRVKRGLPDPNEPGGLTKDHAYLSGLHSVRQLTADDVRLLRATKWPVDLLGELRARRNAGEVVPAALLPDVARLRISRED